MAPQDYPSDWNSRRKEVYARDNYACQNCERKGGSDHDIVLHAHHIVPKSKGGTHSKSNLVAVCEDCHYAIHGNSYAPDVSSDAIKNVDEEFFDRFSHIIHDVAELMRLIARYAEKVSTILSSNGDTAANIKNH
jgi:ribosomal protein L37AE/L43A